LVAIVVLPLPPLIPTLDKHLCNFPGGVSIALIYWL
jgi:hypothetical protein